MADGDSDDRIDRGLARYVPPDRTAGELVLKATALASDLLPGLDAMDPRLGSVVKGAALLGVWFFDRRKVDRVFPLLAAMKDKIREVEAKQDGYVRREEFRDLFEETLRRIADQPGPDRRAWLQNIFLNVIDQPKDHTENRLFLRLADEASEVSGETGSAGHERVQRCRRNANRVQNADVPQQAARAELVHGCVAHAEGPRDLGDRQQAIPDAVGAR